MRLADSHCHLTDEAFAPDSAAVLERARAAGVARVVTIASDAADSRAALRLAESEPGVWCTAGVHPHAAGRRGAGDMEIVREAAARTACVAIGETGLDYHYDNAPRDAQRRSLAAHAELAAETGLPLVVHSRNAEADTAALIRDGGGGVRGVVHCFTGSTDLMADALAAGWLVSFTGVTTFKGFDAGLVRDVPADRYMIETDAPWLAPAPKRGKRNEPAFVRHVAEAVARIRDVPPAQIARETWDNAARFFGLDDDAANPLCASTRRPSRDSPSGDGSE